MATVPLTRGDVEAARERIVAEHKRLRTLLQDARRLADAALETAAPAFGEVAQAIGDLRAAVESHLAFEESILLPILNSDLPAGPEWAARLQAEHEHHRTVLATVHSEAMASPQLPLLAAKLAFLAEWLLADMRDEEQSLLKRYA
jgi:iron-sulfur cluster repair protein YtfE (RIC family)